MNDESLKQASIHGSLKVALQRGHYDRVIAEASARSLVYERTLEPETGDAFFVGAGQVIRLEQRHERTQIVDWWWFSEDMSTWQEAMNTNYFEIGMFLEPYSRVWSNIRGMRPLATMVADETPADFVPEGWVSNFWGYHCSPTWHQAGWPELPAGQNACHLNAMQGLLRIPAIAGIEAEALRKETVQRLASLANYQTFQPLKWEINGAEFSFDSGAAPSVPSGTGIEFYAEGDSWVVLSSCPWVDQSGAVGTVDPVPVYVSVWDTGIDPLPAPEWLDWESAFYDAVADGTKDTTPRSR
ncbi:MAG: DUF1989 domain-containing protein [Acidimicrobiia bacterium]